LEAQPIGERTGREHLPGAALPRDIAAGEQVEKELDGFISRRHDQRVRSEGKRAVEESWRASECREEARRAEEEHAGRIGVFRHLQRV